MFLAIVFVVIATFTFFSGFIGLINNVEGFLWDLIGGVIFGVLGVLMLSKKKNSPAPKDAVIPRAADKSYDCKIAGVTFDGRQDVLRRIFLNGEQDECGNVVFDDVSIEKYNYEGEEAFMVLCAGEQIGNIPKENIDDFLIISDRIFDRRVLVNWFTDDEEKKRIYFAKLWVAYI